MRLAIALTCAAFGAQAEPALQQVVNLIWDREEPWFGGFSGVEVLENGSRVVLLTDRRTLMHGIMIRQDGQLTGVNLEQPFTIRYANSQKVRYNFADSEGLAIAADGTAYVSFENATRVAEVSLESGITSRLPDHPDFARMKRNAGLEALAIHPDGTLYTLPEQTAPHETSFPLYTFASDQWQRAYEIPRDGPFLTTGADFDAKGRFYLLERALGPLGFRSRIRRFDLEAPDLGAETLLETGPGQFDNLEALAIWIDTAGVTHLTLVSDDNFRTIQRTQIVEYRLTE